MQCIYVKHKFSVLCDVSCLYKHKHTPLTHFQRLFYRNWCNRPLCYKPRPRFTQERWLVWRDRISPLIGAAMCQSERGPSAHGGNEATLTPISDFVAFDFLQHRTESSVRSESRRRWENIHFPEMMKCFRDCIRLQDKEWLFICTDHT